MGILQLAWCGPLLGDISSFPLYSLSPLGFPWGGQTSTWSNPKSSSCQHCPWSLRSGSQFWPFPSLQTVSTPVDPTLILQGFAGRSLPHGFLRLPPLDIIRAFSNIFGVTGVSCTCPTQFHAVLTVQIHEAGFKSFPRLALSEELFEARVLFVKLGGSSHPQPLSRSG